MERFVVGERFYIRPPEQKGGRLSPGFRKESKPKKPVEHRERWHRDRVAKRKLKRFLLEHNLCSGL